MHKGQRLKESKNVGGKKSLFLKCGLLFPGQGEDAVQCFKRKSQREWGKGFLCPLSASRPMVVDEMSSRWPSTAAGDG